MDSEKPDVPTESTEQTNTQATETTQQPTEQYQPLFYQYDGVNWYMIPEEYQYFVQFQTFLKQLYGTINDRWSDLELSEYRRCLIDISNYITNYVYTGQIPYYSMFERAMQAYGANVNPIGFELYNKQVDYCEKKASGHDFNLDKKNKKKGNQAQKQQSKPKPKEEKKEQEIVVIRKDDPTVTAEQLKAKTWEADKYTDMESFHLQSANLIFIGHVDSGKSTLTGNIMTQLKLVDQQEIARNKQQAKQTHMQAFEMGFISDFDPSERRRGKTLECAKMMFALKNRRFTLFDAPGHKNYVPSMIMGACQADIAVLIVSAKQGEFESGFDKEGQTKEHAMLAKALGVHSLVVAVTKMGTQDWAQARYAHIKSQVGPFLQNSCGFPDVHFVPVDSLNNQNIHTKYEECTWYKGGFLMEYLQKAPLPPRDPDGPLRIPIIDKFKDVGQFFLYGKLQSGKIAFEGQTVTLLPSREYVVIREIFNAKDQKLPYALAGENVKLRIKGSDESIFHRGDMLCSNLNYCQESMQFKANLTVLELPEHKKILSSGYECIIHLHAVAQEAQISQVQAKFDKATKKYVKATYLLPGESGRVVVKLKRSSVCLQKFDFMQSLGRFTLRDEGKTMGFGEVTKIKPAKTLTKEQKDQLGVKTEETSLNAEMSNVTIKEETKA